MENISTLNTGHRSANFKYHWDKFNRRLEIDQKDTIKNELIQTITATWEKLTVFNNFTDIQYQGTLTNVPLHIGGKYRGKV